MISLICISVLYTLIYLFILFISFYLFIFLFLCKDSTTQPLIHSFAHPLIRSLNLIQQIFDALVIRVLNRGLAVLVLLALLALFLFFLILLLLFGLLLF